MARRLSDRAWSKPDKILPPTLVSKSTVDATVSTQAVIDRLLQLLEPERNELVFFDINRSAVKTTVLLDDPGPLTSRLMTDGSLPLTRMVPNMALVDLNDFSRCLGGIFIHGWWSPADWQSVFGDSNSTRQRPPALKRCERNAALSQMESSFDE